MDFSGTVGGCTSNVVSFVNLLCSFKLNADDIKLFLLVPLARRPIKTYLKNVWNTK